MATNSQRVAYNSVAQIVGRIVVSGLGILVISLSTRYLGVTNYGQLATAAIFIGLFATLTDAGISNITIRELAQNKRPAAEIIGSILFLRVLVSIFIAIVAAASGSLLYHMSGQAYTRQAIAYLSITLILATLQSTVTSTLVARLRNDLIVIGDILGRITTIALTYYVISRDLGFHGLILATLAGATVNFTSDMCLGLAASRPVIRYDPRYLRYIIGLTVPLAVASILNTIYFRADSFLISLFLTSAQVGIYGIAYKVIELTMSFPIFFMGAVYPLMCRVVEDPAKLHDLTIKSTRLLGMAAAPITVGVIILSSNISILLGGKAFIGAALPMSILMLGNYLIYFNAVYSSSLIAANYQKRLLRLTYITISTNIILNLVAIPLWGLAGAATSVVLTEGLQLFLLRYYYRKWLVAPDSLKLHLPALLNAIAMGIAVYLARDFLVTRGYSNILVLVLCVAIGVVSYAALAITTKQFNIDEIKQLVRAS